jgi:uncharacterized protein with von Willebrand factor type A (vWA) domain
MKHSVLRHSTFFEHMEEFGYMHDLEGLLPEGFTAVFEIARVLEDENSPLFKKLASVMSVTSHVMTTGTEDSREWKPNRHMANSEEYEAGLMGSFSDIKRIFPQQHLLPDQIFMQRFAQRSLWINVPRTPVVIPFKTSSSDYAPDNFKQKVYVLLDTSTSMASHHRIQMAKAVVYVFLKRNLLELGHVYLRTFDSELGPLQTASDMPALRRLIHYTMRIGKLGNGTVMEHAIMQAVADIRAHSELSGAEILIVTDGACHLDSTRITDALGDKIRINTIKIGNAEIFADEKLLKELASNESSPRSEQLRKLEEELRRTKRDIETTAHDHEKVAMRSHAQALTQRIAELRDHIVVDIKRSYGREIETLSKTFVQVDDITTDQIFTLRQSEIEEIRQLLEEVEMDFEEDIDADSLREAALLFEHVQMLLQAAGDEGQRQQLQEMADHLHELLKGLIENEKSTGALGINIARSDLHDLQMMLGKTSGGMSILELLVIVIRKTWRKVVVRRK